MYLIYILLLISLFITFFEFYKLKKISFLINIFILYLIIEISVNFEIWHLVFLSNELWRNIIMFVVFLSFIIVLNLIKDLKFEVVFLNIMVLMGSMMIITCDNLIVIYLGLELQTFSLFILISKNRVSLKGSEAALKYFILGALSSGLFLLGISFIFSNGSSLNLRDLYLTVTMDKNLIQISSFLICLSLFFKLALFPLHFWVADIYEGSSWDVISLLSTIPKISVLSIVLQMINYSSFFIICGVISIILGTIGAMNQTKVKRLLAYSGIGHMGFIILGFGLLTNQGLEASFIYLFIYIFTILGIFSLIYGTLFTKNYFIVELGGLNLINKLIAFSWLVFFLSIAGIPPFAGFINKWLILLALVNSNYLVPVLIGVLFSAIAAGYYLRVVKITYFQKTSSYISWENILKPKFELNPTLSFITGISIYLSVFLIIHPSSIFIPFYMGFNYFF
uniref:NADH:ubiquinone reductase (H(+)-translocating) n=1 Tax=Nemopsis bachei TaxID=1104537 RepID=G9ISV1_9CNID|nr:NADH dehydrogenase subunit 2 [Nemopsis bachei]